METETYDIKILGGKTMLKHAYQLLASEYQKCCRIVQGDEYLTLYANEKYRHSLQVMGAANYLLQHISEVQGISAEKLEIIKTAVLLHDIGRFTEIALHLKSQKCDHGVVGAEFLQSLSQFNEIRIWLPVRHHGHLIEELYADEQFRQIENKALQKEVEHICFIIRDADKIANMNMLTHEENILPLFLGIKKYNPQVDGVLSPEVLQEAFEDQTITRSYLKTAADFSVWYISWFKDINYQIAIDFCKKLDILPNLLKILDKYCMDEKFKHDFNAHIWKYAEERKYLP